MSLIYTLLAHDFEIALSHIMKSSFLSMSSKIVQEVMSFHLTFINYVPFNTKILNRKSSS